MTNTNIRWNTLTFIVKYPKMLKLGSIKRSKVQKLWTAQFSTEVLSKMVLYAKMSVRDAHMFTSSTQTKAWFEIPDVW